MLHWTYLPLLTPSQMDSHVTWLQNKFRNLTFLQLFYEVSAHLAKINGDLMATLLLFPKCWLNRLIFHLCECIYTKSNHTEFESKSHQLPSNYRTTISSSFKLSAPISKLHWPVPEEIGCRMPWNADHLSMPKAKAKYHIPAGRVRSQTPILSLMSTMNASTESRESICSEHIILAQLLDSGNFQDMQLHCVSLQFTTSRLELSTEMNSSVGSMSSLQEIHLKQGGSYTELAKSSRKALGATQNEPATQPLLMKPGTALGRLTFFKKRSQLSCQKQLVSFPSFCFCRWWFYKTWTTNLSNEKAGGKIF